ncbi:AP-4 complex subunit epsilon-1-like [Hyalella azteca]|uniref:AP-4 complex subunit epsilon-1-like n=1 Tax=Hyalella azteca TaxID=294128 RepID=A0A979FX46_HYAAZ|nr:AP-4 complex subunit epsilon-1-like [Hyalella azteca]
MEDERQVLDVSAEQWLSELSAPSCSAATMSAVLQRALVGASRGHIYPQLHIHGLKLTQAPGVMHKKMGYLYLSVCAGHSELSLLTTNALHKDLQSRDAIALLAAITALPSVMRGGLPPQLLHALCNCLHHPMSLVRRRACQVLYAGLSVWGAPRHDVSAASRRPSSLGDRSSPLGTDCGSCHDSQGEIGSTL